MRKTSDTSLERSSQGKMPHAKPQEVDHRIFSRVYSHIAQHRGAADAGVLLDLISAISLDRSASYFEILERLEARSRDLGLELVKARLCAAFPPQAWEDAYQFATELNQRNGEMIRQDSAVRAPLRGQDSPPSSRIAQDPKREARDSDRPLRVVAKKAAARTRGPVDPVTAAMAASADFGSERRARSPFGRGARTALAYASVYGGFDGFKYLWGAAAATAVIGFFVLIVVLDERVHGSRLEAFAWLSEPVAPPPQVQVQAPVVAGLDTPAQPALEQAPEQITARVDTTPAPPEQTLEGARGVVPEQSTREEPQPVAEEPTAPGVDRIAITPPLASATESSVPDNSLLAPDALLSTPPPAAQAEQFPPAVIASEPPKPAPRAVARQAKPVIKARSTKPAKPRVAEKLALPTTQPAMEAAAPVVNEVKSKPPEPPPAAEFPTTPALEDSTPRAAAVESTDDVPSAAVDKPAPDPVAALPRVEPTRDASQPQEIIVANPSFVERLMGFQPGERIARILPGRRANQPHFIRQLEGVDGPAENGSGAEPAVK